MSFISPIIATYELNFSAGISQGLLATHIFTRGIAVLIHNCGFFDTDFDVTDHAYCFLKTEAITETDEALALESLHIPQTFDRPLRLILQRRADHSHTATLEGLDYVKPIVLHDIAQKVPLMAERSPIVLLALRLAKFMADAGYSGLRAEQILPYLHYRDKRAAVLPKGTWLERGDDLPYPVVISKQEDEVNFLILFSEKIALWTNAVRLVESKILVTATRQTQDVALELIAHAGGLFPPIRYIDEESPKDSVILINRYFIPLAAPLTKLSGEQKEIAMRDMIKSVALLHQKRLVHGSIRLEKFMAFLEPHFHVRLTDYERALSDEAADTERDFYAADVFDLGLALAQLIWDSFSAPTILEKDWFYKQLDGRFILEPLLKFLPLINAMLSPDPRSRILCLHAYESCP